MKGFYIDSATTVALLALFDNERPLASKKIAVGPLAKENIFETLEALFREQKLTLSDLRFIGLGIGPGSYTGMRVASSIGATLAYSLNIPLITLTSMDGYDGEVVVLDAKRGNFYVKVGTEEPKLVSSEQLKEIPGRKVLAHESEPRLEKIGHLLFDKLGQNKLTDPKNVNLIYLQNPY